MRSIKILCFTIISLVFGINVLSQGSLTLELSPEEPIVGDDIIVKALVGFNTGSGYKIHSLSWIDNNNLVVNIFCWVGMTSSPSSNIVYVDIGQLPEGTYSVIANLKVNTTYQDFDDLSLYHKTDSDTISFRVGQQLGIIQEDGITKTVNLYPNPAINQLNFRLADNSKTIKLEVLDISGNVIKTVPYTNQNNEKFINSIDISELKNGVYFFRFTTGKSEVVRKFIKK